MKIESPAFTQADVDRFEMEMLDHERLALADRLERVAERLAAIGPRVTRGQGTESWSAHEVLAHIAVVSKFYGVVVHKISSGQMTEVDLLSYVNLRDVAGQQAADLDPEEILQAALSDQHRTAKLLRDIDAVSLRREATLDGGAKITAEYVARTSLINHLEAHLDQLEQSLS